MNDTDKGGENLPDEIDAQEARVAVGKRQLCVIDIRSEEEFAEERIFGSEHCDPDEVSERLAAMRDDEDDGHDAVLLVSTDGSDAAELAERLREDDHQVTVLEGGFKSWADKHNPTAPGMDEEYQGPKLAVPGAVASETQPDEDGDDADEGDEDGSQIGADEPGQDEPEAGADGERSEPDSDETVDSETAERADET